MGIIAPTTGYTGFTITVDTALAGSASDTFIIPKPAAGTYNYTVNWGDGNIETDTTNTDHTHVYSGAGVYTIEIFGTFPQIRFNAAGDILKLLSIDNWGRGSWSTFDCAFEGCANMIVTAKDRPDLSAVTDMTGIFRDCSKFGQPLNHWDVSNVQIFSHALRGTVFDLPLSSWDMSAATDLSHMFRDMPFNQALNAWDVSGVTTMLSMFWDNLSFNQALNLWDTGVLSIATNMFRNTNFDQDVSSFDITALTTGIRMFLDTTLSTANYNALLVGWEAQVEPLSITFDGGNSTHSGAGTTARGVLVGTSSWTITDGGPA